MEKEILIDASQENVTGTVRVKLYKGNVYENEQKKQLKGNVFLGRISRIEPSLQAAFVDFGNERHGFLAFNDIQTQYYQIPTADKELILKEEEEVRKELEEETKDLIPNDSEVTDENSPIKQESDTTNADSFDDEIWLLEHDVKNQTKIIRTKILMIKKSTKLELKENLKDIEFKK